MTLEGAAALERKMLAAPRAVARAVRPAMEKSADEMVALMRSFAPAWLRPSIKWTWGGAPEGATVFGGFGGDVHADLRITIYSDDHRAAWFEFGTGPRYHKKTGRYTGRITAQPFFWPAYRMLKDRASRRIIRAMRKALRETMA